MEEGERVGARGFRNGSMGMAGGTVSRMERMLSASVWSGGVEVADERTRRR